MTRRFSLFALAVPFLAVGSAAASSTGTRLTKENIGEQPVRIVISAAESRDDSVRFTVSVRREKGKDPPALSAWLSVFDGDAQIANCRVAEERRDGAVVYEFLVARKYLEKSTFLMEETDAARRGLPVGAAYWFHLRDFAPAAPGEQGPQQK